MATIHYNPKADSDNNLGAICSARGNVALSAKRDDVTCKNCRRMDFFNYVAPNLEANKPVVVNLPGFDRCDKCGYMTAAVGHTVYCDN